MKDHSKEDARFVLDSTNDFAASQLDKFTSHYRRKAHFEKNPFFVAPEPLQIGSELIEKPMYSKNILKTLSCIFANSDYKNTYFEYNNNHECVENNYSRYCCGQNHKNNIFFQTNKNAIQIQLFFDDFQVTSELKTKFHKVCAIYFIIYNFPPKFSPQLQNMYLVSLCDSTIVSNNGCNSI